MGSLVPQLILSNDHGNIIANYTTNKGGFMKLSLYTAYGALITHLKIGMQPAGSYSQRIELQAMGIPQGTYLVKLSVGELSKVGSITTFAR